MSSDNDHAEPSRILVVDDHPLFRAALRELIQHQAGWEVCGEAADAAETMRLVGETRPDLVLVDISLGTDSGIELIKSICAKYGDVPMLVVSMHPESLYGEKAVQAGAMGYVMKHAPPKVVKAAIEEVLAGKMYLSHKLAMAMVARLMHRGNEDSTEPSITRLSERELEVFRLLGQGLGARQIAQELQLSVATIHSFRARIKEKLDLKSSSELLLRAINWVKEEAERNP